MKLGSITITPRAVETHKDSYRIEQLTVVSVRRPFLPFAVMAGLGGSAFGAGFYDLLYTHELVILPVSIFVAVLAGTRIGQLQLLSRDLRGSELTGAIWGTWGELNAIRREIMAAMQAREEGPTT